MSLKRRDLLPCLAATIFAACSSSTMAAEAFRPRAVIVKIDPHQRLLVVAAGQGEEVHASAGGS